MGTCKKYYDDHIGEDGYGDAKVIDMWEKALETCTPEIWNATVRHTEKIIQEWYTRDRIIEDIPQIIIQVSNESDSDTDFSSSD